MWKGFLPSCVVVLSFSEVSHRPVFPTCRIDDGHFNSFEPSSHPFTKAAAAAEGFICLYLGRARGLVNA